MTVWISRRAEAELAAELGVSRAAPGALAGIRIAVTDAVDHDAVGNLRAAGAVIIGTVAPHRSDRPVADGEADIAVTTQAAATAVGVTPTAAALRTRLGVVAADLTLANLAVTVLAANATARTWPAYVRLAAPVEPVVGVVVDRHSRTAFATVTAALSDAGARLVTVESGTRSIPDGLDAVITAECPTVTDDLCAVTMAVDGLTVTVLTRAFDDATALDIAASVTHGRVMEQVWPLSAADPVELVVFGAHLRGGPLTHQLTDLGSRWAGEITTAPRYRMTVLPTIPAKPAITRVPDDVPGTALYGHRWLMSAAALGRFLTALPAPMQLGKVEFDDGTWRTAFGCDAAAATGPDISAYGSWSSAVADGAVHGAGRAD